jgi:hypothetical protein
MRTLILLILLISISGCGSDKKEKLFNSLYQGSFAPKDGVIIEFTDSTSYKSFYTAGTPGEFETGSWSVRSSIAGTYLLLDSREMRLKEISDSVITFSAGDFEPKFVRVKAGKAE